MHLPLAATRTPHLEVLAEAGSTNDVLVSRAAGLPHMAAVVTDNQTAGRGRLGRSWVAPAGRCLAVSVLLRPVTAAGTPLPLEDFGWFPLVAGLAMTRAVAPLVAGRTGLKWPNDVQVEGRKVSGLLAELLPGADALVVGAGVNLSLAAEELPTSVATSLTLEGAEPSGDALADTVLSGYLARLGELVDGFLAGGPDAVQAQVAAACTTLGQRVRVELPGGSDMHGTAVGIDRSGRLVVRRADGGPDTPVAAGDVTHLRYE